MKTKSIQPDAGAPRRHLYNPIRSRLLVLAALSLPVAASAQVTYLVNDTFSDTDRIGGLSGASTTTSSPLVNTATATNTQWIANSTSQLVASASGMLWTMSTSSRLVIGYFPTVTIVDGADPITISLTFTTGTNGGTANNLRLGIFDSSANGYRTTDGITTNESKVNGDVGYGFFSVSSNVGGGNTTNLALRTFERVTTTSTDILGTSSDYGTNIGGSSGATGYLQANTSYTFAVEFSYVSGTLSITSSLEGGNLSGLSYTVTDSTSPVLTLDTIAMRLGGGSNQFSTLNFTGLTVTQPSAAAVPEPSAYAALAGVVALAAGAWLKRRKDARC